MTPDIYIGVSRLAYDIAIIINQYRLRGHTDTNEEALCFCLNVSKLNKICIMSTANISRNTVEISFQYHIKMNIMFHSHRDKCIIITTKCN